MKGIDAITIDQARHAATERSFERLSRLAREDAKDLGGEDAAELRGQAVKFEALFMKFMLDSMRKTIHESELFGDPSSVSNNIYKSMLDAEYANLMAEHQSFGLAEMVLKQFGIDSQDELSDKSLLGGSSPLAGRFASPVVGEVTSPFGLRVHPILGELRMHTGIDLAVPVGRKIHSAEAGKVVFAGRKSGYGKLVIVDHQNGFCTYYGHLSDFMVGPGDTVRRGQPIARSGNTGRSTGPHLHFEIRIGGRPVNPEIYVDLR